MFELIGLFTEKLKRSLDPVINYDHLNEIYSFCAEYLAYELEKDSDPDMVLRMKYIFAVSLVNNDNGQLLKIGDLTNKGSSLQCVVKLNNLYFKLRMLYPETIKALRAEFKKTMLETNDVSEEDINILLDHQPATILIPILQKVHFQKMLK